VKIAYLFPGQGSQYVGMGRNLYENFNLAKNIFARADDILQTDLSSIIFNGPEERLNQTKICQPAILTVSITAYEVLAAEYGIAPAILAGHSLGEYSGLVAAGALSFEDGLQLVEKRANFMSEASQKHPGRMLAVLGLPLEKIKEICKEVQPVGLVAIANINSPEQIVVSGEIEGIKKFEEYAIKSGVKKLIPLRESGPFHTVFMESAAKKLNAELERIEIKRAKISLLANSNAKEIREPEEIKNVLFTQMTHPVLWLEIVKEIKKRNIETFLEIGPKKVLTKLLRRIDPNLLATNVEDKESLKRSKEIICV